jgi:phosphoribosylformylglycinamidine cyclo-ligase
MFNIFNMGIGMVLALDAKEADEAIRILNQSGEKAQIIGHVQAGDNQIVSK